MDDMTYEERCDRLSKIDPSFTKSLSNLRTSILLIYL